MDGIGAGMIFLGIAWIIVTAIKHPLKEQTMKKLIEKMYNRHLRKWCIAHDYSYRKFCTPQELFDWVKSGKEPKEYKL